MELQWYPGHMTKALRQIKEDIKLIDLVIELLDARIPEASRNPDISNLAQGKSRLLVLAKSDLADEAATAAWLSHYREQGFFASALDTRSRAGLSALRSEIEKASAAKRERDARRGIKNRPVRALVCGIPNSGKSTLINTISGRKSAKTGNKPGVTRGKQWIRLSGQLELLDTPGILWPKFEDPEVGVLLAGIGAIKDEIAGREELAIEFYHRLASLYPGRISEKYDIGEDLSDADVLSELAMKRSLLAAGGEPDISRAAGLILDDMRGGKLGRITFQRV